MSGMGTTVGGVSRRQFVLTAATAVLASGTVRGQKAALTAQQVVDRIRAHVGSPWREGTVDTFKAGDPNEVVTGVATTTMATLGVLRQAAQAGRNLIITHEPTFYTPADVAGPRANDPVYLAKKAFIEQHRLVVWRFSDHWLARRPNAFVAAMADALGWTGGRSSGSDRIFTVPPTMLASIEAHVRTRLAIRGGMRSIGNARMPVRRVALSPGTTDLQDALVNLRAADVLVSGEPREWEAVEYVFDMQAAGQPKAMIMVGRIASEEPGMRACAAWLRALVPEVPVEHIAVGDPYWSPVA